MPPMTKIQQIAAKSKLKLKYTTERDNYLEAATQGSPLFVEFNTTKAAAYQAKLDALNEAKP